MGNFMELYPVNNSIENLLRSFFGRSVLTEEEKTTYIKMDVSENDEAYTVHAEMPGMKKEDIKVTADGNQVSISAEINRAKEDKQNGRVLHSERYYGCLYRTFTLAQPVQEDKIQATYKDGILELLLPKRQAKKLNHIPVQ
ncbi:MAG: Hsp20/alpha crystallin family protein [Pseudomonadota bacterium]